MHTLIAILIGVLFASGIYCLLRRSIMKLVIGVMLLGQGANLLVFTAAGLIPGVPPFAPEASGRPPEGHADPLPQALVLTAIVIGFGLIVFTLSLLQRACRATGSDDLDTFNRTDGIS